jgi:hypothetical protein
MSLFPSRKNLPALLGCLMVLACVAGVLAPSARSQSPPLYGVSASDTGGTPQSAVINTAFASSLQVMVKDVGGNPVPGVTVTFTAPGSGASGTFAGGANTAVTNSSGVATSATFTANGTTGAFLVTASFSGGPSATFSLKNVDFAVVPVTTSQP